jgi:ABC-2 type transport system permease protein
MRLMSEEYRSGSFEALRTAPAGDWSVTLGKYLGSVGYLVLMLVPSLVYPLVLMLVSEPTPDWGPIGAGYLMLLLVGMLYLAIGMLASSLTASQTLAFLGTVMSLILVMVLTDVIIAQLGVYWAGILRTLSITNRVGELAKGVIDTATVAFFLIGSIWMLVLSAGTLEIKRLGRPRAYTLLTTVVFVLATGAAAGFAGYITHLHHERFDVTSTSAHRLSDRAERIVERLDDPTRIVLAVSRSNINDARTLDIVRDVLENYDESSPLITTSFIDLDQADAIESTKTLLRELADQERDVIDANLQTLRQSAEQMQQASTQMNVLSQSLARLREAIPANTQTNVNNRAVFEQRGAIVRIAAQNLGSESENLLGALAPFLNGDRSQDQLFPFDTTAQPLAQSLTQVVTQLDDLAAQLDAFANAEDLEPGPRSVARPIVQQTESIRDGIAQTLDRIVRLPRVDAVRVDRALQTGETMLIIGPPEQGVAAVDLDALMVSSRALDDSGISAIGYIGPRAQELIASGIARLVAPAQPVLIFVHSGQPGELLGASKLYTQTVSDLRDRGIDSVEWAALEQTNPPSLDRVDPLGNRPRVYFVIAPDSTTQSTQSGLSGAKRAEALGEVVERLVVAGESMVVSLSPSIFPSAGRTDPLADAIEPFGIIPETGHPLLSERMGPMGRIADPVSAFVPQTPDESDPHPVARTLDGLSSVLTWAIPLRLEDRDGVSQSALMMQGGSDEIWGESAWLTLWRRPAQSRQVMPNQPVFNERDDIRRDSWCLAAAAQREQGGTQQRLVVVGSNGWSGDAIFAGQAQVIDGRVMQQWPGNAALFDSSIAWLAGMDDLIGTGSEARPIATIKTLDARQLSTIRWILLAGMPALVLILGMAYRLAFG